MNNIKNIFEFSKQKKEEYLIWKKVINTKDDVKGIKYLLNKNLKHKKKANLSLNYSYSKTAKQPINLFVSATVSLIPFIGNICLASGISTSLHPLTIPVLHVATLPTYTKAIKNRNLSSLKTTNK